MLLLTHPFLDRWLAKLEAFATHVKGSALVGDALSLADVYAYHTAFDYFDNAEVVHAAFKASAPALWKAAETIKENAHVAAYLAKRPVTAF